MQEHICLVWTYSQDQAENQVPRFCLKEQLSISKLDPFTLKPPMLGPLFPTNSEFTNVTLLL